MATRIWQGGVEAVAQIASGTVDTYDAASTYTITIGGYGISASGDGSVNATAAALVAACEASTHSYFAAITWTNPSGATVTATAETAGVPFDAALTVAGGTGTVTDFSDSTACTGPHHADDADNWGGTLPGAADTAIVAGGPSLLYGLDGISGALTALEVRKTFTGKVGLEYSQFATSLDGDTLDATVPEYRLAYLEVSADTITLGEHIGAGAPAGSARIAIDQQKAGASTLVVESTSSSTVASRPAVRYLATHASADIEVRSAPGGFGVAIEAGETATIGDILVADKTAASRVYVGAGTTLTNFRQYGGQGELAAAATVAEIECRGGALNLVGSGYTVTLLQVYGGTVVDTHLASGVEWTTIELYGGTLELPAVYDAGSGRTVTNLKLTRGRLEADLSDLTITTLTAPVTASDLDAVAITLSDV